MKIETKKQQVIKALDCMEKGLYCPHTISWITDTIYWLSKWKHITQEECGVLCGRAIEVMNLYKMNK